MDSEEWVIQITDMVFRWRREGPPTLAIDTLSVRRGERLFIKGDSGSGKSTLLSLLGGVIVPQQGSVQVLGRPLTTMGGVERDHFRADHVGFIFQMFNLLPYLSPVENVLLPCRFSALRRENIRKQGKDMIDEAKRILGELGLTEAVQRDGPSTELSVGQQQRVAAARALIGAPELVIADEPTSALDWDRRLGFLELLERECAQQGTTLVFVSHDPSLESLFDRTIDLAHVNRVLPKGQG